MKRIKYFLTVLIALLVATTSFAGVDTTLDTPLEITKPATILRQVSFQWNDTNFEVIYNLVDADGAVVQSRTCVLTDWSEAGANAFCSDNQFVRQEDCEHVNTWTDAVCSDAQYVNRGACETGGAIWLPAFCSNDVFTDQAACEVVNVWTPQEIIPHNDFSAGNGAVVRAMAVGKAYRSIIANYLQGKCKSKWNLTGREN